MVEAFVNGHGFHLRGGSVRRRHCRDGESDELKREGLFAAMEFQGVNGRVKDVAETGRCCTGEGVRLRCLITMTRARNEVQRYDIR